MSVAVSVCVPSLATRLPHCVVSSVSSAWLRGLLRSAIRCSAHPSKRSICCVCAAASPKPFLSSVAQTPSLSAPCPPPKKGKNGKNVKGGNDAKKVIPIHQQNNEKPSPHEYSEAMVFCVLRGELFLVF